MGELVEAAERLKDLAEDMLRECEASIDSPILIGAIKDDFKDACVKFDQAKARAL